MSFPGFYPIIDTAICRDRQLDPLALAAAILRGGARLVQLRHKPLSEAGGHGAGSRRWLELAEQMQVLAAAHGASLVVNDRADIARLSGAAGVHVGQEDLPVADARQILGADAIVGISTHTPRQVEAALLEPATYVAVGPIFRTGTKDTGYTARGLALIGAAAGRGRPVVAIGGITLDTLPQVMAAGAAAVAVITDLLVGGNPEARTRQYLDALAAVARDRPR